MLKAGAPLVERYALTLGKSWGCTPATQVFPGLEVPVVKDECVAPEEIVRVTRKPYQGFVYDLTVPGVHNYLAGGIVVHNSIYRFRHADVKLFQELKRRMPHEGRLGLTRNFRSQPAVLHFVNALFALHIAGYEPLPEAERHARAAQLAPVIRGQKGEYKDLFEDMLRRGFVRARVDGQLVRLTEDLKLDRRIKHHIAIVVDRLKNESKIRTRLADAVEQALALGEGSLINAVEQ